MGSKMAMEFGVESMATHISDNGKIARQMDMVSTSGRMETNTRVNGKHL